MLPQSLKKGVGILWQTAGIPHMCLCKLLEHIICKTNYVPSGLPKNKLSESVEQKKIQNHSGVILNQNVRMKMESPL